MIFGRKILTALALASIAWLLPTQGFCYEGDPYAYKSLVGRLQFEFEREAEDRGSTQTTSYRFEQKYALDFRGYILNRRLLIYDAGYNYTNNDYSATNTSSNTGISNYYLRTTALPLSAIPLTLYTDRRTSRTTSGASETTSTDTKYGLRWYLYFRTLPKTTLAAERDNLELSDGSTYTTDTYRVDMEKVVGPTENYFSYNLVNTDTTSKVYSRYAINFTNTTKVSRTTNFYLGATRSEGTSSIDPTIALTGLSLRLRSTPSKDFAQTHSYNFYQNESGNDTQTGSNYSGDMRYEFSKRLQAYFALNVYNIKSETETTNSESNSYSTAVNVYYALSNTTSLRQLVSYSSSETNSSDMATNLTDIDTFRTLTSVDYRKRLNWSDLSASAGLGYTDEQSGTERAGQAIEQNYSLSLSNIDLNKYVLANTSANYSTRTTISGNDINHTRYLYTLSFYNKVWKNYVDTSAVHTRSATKTYLSDFETRKETYQLRAKSTYFKNTQFSASANHNRTFEELTGHGRSTSLSFSASHNRRLFKGHLGLAYSFTTNRSTYEGGTEKINTTLYSLSYSRTLIKDMLWNFYAYNSTQEASSSHTSTTSIKNTITYPLRSWLLSGYHEYRITDQSNTDRTETILLLRASRIFVRIW